VTSVGSARSVPLSREAIVAAAVALADRAGLARLSMRRLAADLGVEAMSLYNHVRNKDDLVDAMVEAVLAGIARPAAGAAWRDALRARALSMRAAFLTHPWAPDLIAGRLNTGPNMLALYDATIGCLHAAGFGYAQADHLCNAMDSLIYGFHLLERSFPIRPEGYADAARLFLPGLDRDRLPHLHALGTLVADGHHSGVHDFSLALDLLLGAIGRSGREG
jgi:AcrR family transcriptional regulator